MKIAHTLFLIAISFLAACTMQSSSESDAKRTHVEIMTSMGTITIALYNETPLHRDNFLTLVQDHIYDSLLFHRVIENFVVQGGDPDSKHAAPDDTLGSGGLDYQVKAEFDTTLFHKRGVVGAARDSNPVMASSATQFYIVTGKLATDSLLEVAETRINNRRAYNAALNDPANKSLKDSMVYYYDHEMERAYERLMDSLTRISETYTNYAPYQFTSQRKEIYKTIGGIPHLDGGYTVFGEVTKGMDIIDKISQVQTNALNRPLKDVRIIKMRIVEQPEH